MIVVWRINEQCNLACPFCAFDKTLDRPRRSADVAEVERFVGLLVDYGQQTGDSVLISWIGGEPLLWPPLFALGQRLRQRGKIRLSATTNGTTLHRPAVVQDVLEGFDELTVSVDGPALVHDALRRAPGSWQQIARAISELAMQRQTGGFLLKTLRANVVLMRDNLSQFAACCRELAGMGVDEITFNALGGRDRPEYFDGHRLRPAEMAALAALLPSLRAELAGQGVRLCGGDTYLGRLNDAANDRQVVDSDCSSGRDFLFVDEAGRIAPCHFTSSELGIPSASIQSVDALRALPALFGQRAQQCAPAVCAACPSTHVFSKFAA